MKISAITQTLTKWLVKDEIWELDTIDFNMGTLLAYKINVSEPEFIKIFDTCFTVRLYFEFRKLSRREWCSPILGCVRRWFEKMNKEKSRKTGNAASSIIKLNKTIINSSNLTCVGAQRYKALFSLLRKFQTISIFARHNLNNKTNLCARRSSATDCYSILDSVADISPFNFIGCSALYVFDVKNSKLRSIFCILRRKTRFI